MGIFFGVAKFQILLGVCLTFLISFFLFGRVYGGKVQVNISSKIESTPPPRTPGNEVA